MASLDSDDRGASAAETTPIEEAASIEEQGEPSRPDQALLEIDGAFFIGRTGAEWRLEPVDPVSRRARRRRRAMPGEDLSSPTGDLACLALTRSVRSTSWSPRTKSTSPWTKRDRPNH